MAIRLVWASDLSRWMRIAIIAVCILALGVARASTVSAAEYNVAGLIVDYGDGRISYVWIPFEEDELSGVELLKRSGLDLVTVGFGGMGDAVCQIDDTGCPVDDCRKRLCQTSDPASPFWRYSRQTAPGEWSFAATGASGARVHDGDIDAWSWTGGDAHLPAITMDELALRAGADPGAVNDVSDMPAPAARTEDETGDVVTDTSHPLMNVLIGTGAVLGIASIAVFRARRAERTTQ